MGQYIIQDDIEYDVFNLPENFVIKGDLDLSNMNLIKLPKALSTVHVLGNFYCNNNRLKTLDNSPATVGRGYFADHNDLETPEGCTPIIPMVFSVHANRLLTLQGGPIRAGGYICHSNLLTSLAGISQNEMVCFDCRDNRLTGLDNAPFMVNTYKYTGNKIPRAQIQRYVNLVAAYHDAVQRGIVKSKYVK